MERKHFYLLLNLVRRWLWLLLLAPLMAGAITYWVSRQQPLVYEATARLIVGAIDSPNPDLDALRTGGRLIYTYAEIATMRPVLQGVIDELHLGISIETLSRNIFVKTNEETQILGIQVQDGNPDQAVAVANAVGNALVRLSPASAEAEMRAELNAEATKLQELIDSTEARIQQLEADLQAVSSGEAGTGTGDQVLRAVADGAAARIQQLEAALQATDDPERQRLLIDQIAREVSLVSLTQSRDAERQRVLLDEIGRERNRLSEAHRSLTQLYGTLQNRFTNQVNLNEPAVAATPVASQLQLKVMMASLAGLILALVVAFTFEYFDDTVKTAEDLAQVAGVPVFGAIAKYTTPRGAGRQRLAVQALPGSRAAENYRVLSTTKRLFSKGGDHSPHAVALRSLLISTSQVDNDIGEIEVAANLAVTLAQTGSRVILVDANLRRPTIAQLFGIVDRGGLTDALTGRSERPELVSVDWAPGLSILPTGPVSSDDPFELLASPRAASLVKQLGSQADIVLIVAAPVLSFADSLMLAPRVDGVMLVERSGATRRKAVSGTTQRLHALGADIIGAVLHDGRHRSALGARRGQTGRAGVGSVVAGVRSLAAHLVGGVLGGLRRASARSGRLRAVAPGSMVSGTPADGGLPARQPDDVTSQQRGGAPSDGPVAQVPQ